MTEASSLQRRQQTRINNTAKLSTWPSCSEGRQRNEVGRPRAKNTGMREGTFRAFWRQAGIMNMPLAGENQLGSRGWLQGTESNGLSQPNVTGSVCAYGKRHEGPRRILDCTYTIRGLPRAVSPSPARCCNFSFQFWSWGSTRHQPPLTSLQYVWQTRHSSSCCSKFP